MTRINLVDPDTLHTKHLIAELHELPRVFTLAKAAGSTLHRRIIPSEYVLGSGHVIFFYDKLKFLADRYTALNVEARNRGFNVNEIPRTVLLAGISPSQMKDYVPTKEAIAASAARIKERTKPHWK